MCAVNTAPHRTPRPTIMLNQSFQSLQCSRMSFVLFDTVSQCCDATYLHPWLYYSLLCSQGTNIRLAQHIFSVLYLVNLALVFRIMVKTRKVPPYVLVLMSVTSYRIHSIFILRLFNDPVAMILLYAAINFFIDDHWSLGSLCFSLAVNIEEKIAFVVPMSDCAPPPGVS